MKTNKKGQIDNLLTFAIIFGVSVLGLALIGGLIQDVRTNAINTQTRTLTNESILNPTLGVLQQFPTFGNDTQATSVTNSSVNVSNQTIAIGQGATGFQVTVTNQLNISSGDAGDTWNVTYTYNRNEDDLSFNTSSRGLTGMLNLSGQFGNIGTVIAIVVIIGMLVAAILIFKVTQEE